MLLFNCPDVKYLLMSSIRRAGWRIVISSSSSDPRKTTSSYHLTSSL